MIVAIVDTETNGREPGEVIELAALVNKSAPKVYVPFSCDGAVAPGFEMRFRRFEPEQGSTYKALAVHGIADAWLAALEPSATAASLVADVECFIAHNARFDYGVLGIEPPLVIDTLALSRAFCPDDEGHTLGAMMFRIDVEVGLKYRQNAHEAEADVMACARLLDWLVRFVSPAARTWGTLAALSELFAAPSTIPFGKYKGTAWADLDFGYMRWYLNQSDQDPAIRDRMREEMSYRSGAMARCPHCDGIRAIKDDATNQWSLCDCYKPSVVKS